ncbi:MAG: response regulator [Chloroflexi bacterium]|nr:MAG: response regulator [Chloroflexota bacterium]TMG37878.1 MAG: response regulator [Chloroflexota bacterium]
MTTVLVIDDDQIIVDLLKMVVEDAGHEVVIASAMDRIPQQIAPDLILTDLIPLKSYRRDLAQEWIRDLRSRYPRIPIVVVTAHAEAARDAGQLGADAIVEKPFDVEILGAKIAELLSR